MFAIVRICVCVRSGGKFPSIGSDDPTPLGVENVKIRENSEKIRGHPALGPLAWLT